MACNPQDIVGQRFERLLVESCLPEKNEYGFYEYNVVCDCGTRKIVMRGSLTGGKSKSCGCLNKELSSKRTLELHKNADVSDMIGQIFGKLTVIKRHDQVNSDNKYPYVCKCECGGEKIIAKNNLVSGRTKSCGCFNVNSLKERHQEYRDNFDHQSYIGKVYNKLTIIEYIGYIDGSNGHCFKCQCSCGQIKESVNFSNLIGDRSQSCGCTRLLTYALKFDDYEKHLNEKDFNDKARKKFTNSPERRSVLKRDNNQCFICHGNHDLQVHHIEPWLIHKDIRFEESNLITLCFDCHFDHAHGGLIGQGVDLEWTEKFRSHISSLQQYESVS